MEIWKEINGFEGLYQISNLGRVKSLPKEWIFGKGAIGKHNGKILKGGLTGGYRTLNLRKDNKYCGRRVGRLVAIHFVPNPENKPEVNHINGIKDDDRAENLEWVTGSENIIHAFKTGLKKIVTGTEHPLYGKSMPYKNNRKGYWAGKIGESHPAFGKKGILHNKSILVLNVENGIFYDCIKAAADSINTDNSLLSKKLKGHRRNNTSFILA